MTSTIFLLWNSNRPPWSDRKSTRLNSSHGYISYAVFCLKKKNKRQSYFNGYASMLIITEDSIVPSFLYTHTLHRLHQRSSDHHEDLADHHHEHCVLRLH